MTTPYPGFENERGFFSEHYLSTRFEKDRRSWERRVDLPTSPILPILRALASGFHQSRHALSRDWLEILPQSAGAFQLGLLEFLGYARESEYVAVNLDRTVGIPVLGRYVRSSTQDALWLLEVRTRGEEEWGADPLELTYDPELYPETEPPLPDGNWTVRRVIEAGVYGQSQPPRWLLVVSPAQLVLLDRYKWAEERRLRFDLEVILREEHTISLQVLRALLHRESLVPEGKARGMEYFDDESRRHAQGVSEDLKYALREAVELLGNEATQQLLARRRQRGEAIWSGPGALKEVQLTRECRRYVYRLLCLFFAEAHPELGGEGLRSPAYQAGYSLELLREVETARLSEEGEDTFFLHDSLATLFEFRWVGTPYLKVELLQSDVTHHDFELRPVGASLFDPDLTPLLDQVRFPDRVLRRVIELLSLSRGGRGGRGRISYAHLGVNQLGSVYEALLSFEGFFAREDLVEVKRAQDNTPDALARAWFVPRARIEDKEYETDEIVHDGPEPRVVPKETFLYRRKGYEREASASYYTPESLTQSTVRHALRERLRGNESADELLTLRLCEPAMGSGAFLIEAVNQLAEMYLDRKLRERNETLTPEERLREERRVRGYITARNAFGVDLNPEARELGAMSLWLNCLEPGSVPPDFDSTLLLGNSILGARREVVRLEKQGRGYRQVGDSLRSLDFHNARTKGEVYHFLVPLGEMAEVRHKDLKALAPDAVPRSQAWVKACRKPFTKAEYQVLLRLSLVVDALWTELAQTWAEWRRQREEIIPLPYPHTSEGTSGVHVPWRCEAHARLKWAMDYWCSLWFWSVENYESLPSREEWLEEMSLILQGESADLEGMRDWMRQEALEKADALEEPRELEASQATVDLQTLPAVMAERYGVITSTVKKMKFLHWELEFADFFRDAGGFDLVLGNPPWVRLGWSIKEPLAEFEPQIVLRRWSADQITRGQSAILETKDKHQGVTAACRVSLGQSAFVRHPLNQPLLVGTQPNTYKAFLARAFGLVAPDGMVGFVHPVDHLSEVHGNCFRQACYERLQALFQFANARKRYMFADVHASKTYAISLFRGTPGSVRFHLISNLYDPATMEACLNHDGAGPVPGIKDASGNWELRGHRSRVIQVDETYLRQLGSVLDPSLSPLEARLPLLHARELADSLMKMTRIPQRLENLEGKYMQDPMWHETADRHPADPVFRRETGFHGDPKKMILSGPLFSLANPLAKCPRRNCGSSTDYDVIDLTAIPDDYLPRVNYTPVLAWEEYQSRVRTVPWDTTVKHLECSRVILREYVDSSNERTLQCALIPEALAHVHVCESLSFADFRNLVTVCSLWNTLPYDFLTKAFQIAHTHIAFTSRLPLVDLPDTALHRTLQLNCLTTAYARLWEDLSPQYKPLNWASSHPSLEQEGPFFASDTWTRQSALRSDFARRQALLENDVMVAQALELTLEELIQIYRLVFPILQKYEENTWYDQRGRMVWSPRTGKGLNTPRKEWEKHRNMREGVLTETIQDDTLPDGPHERVIEYAAPFTRPNLIEDYQVAWEYFEKHHG